MKAGRFHVPIIRQTGTNLLISAKAFARRLEELGALSQILPDLVTVLQLRGHEDLTIWLL